MTTAIVPATIAATLSTAATADVAYAVELADAAQTGATRRAYQQDWAAFSAYAAGVGLDVADPQTVAAFVAHMVAASTPWATVSRRLSGVRVAYRLAGLDDATAHPVVRQVVKGARRTLTVATPNQKAPVLVEDLRRMVDVLGDGLTGQRDRALLLVGFGLGARRSELVALDVADLEWSSRGVAVTIRRSKTDQAGAGRVVALPFGRAATCPARALRAWLDAASITSGPVFRSVSRHGQVSAAGLSDRTVALVVQSVAERAGLDASRLAGHSLRAGLVTSAALAGLDDASIQRQTGHTSTAMVRRYTRVADAYRNNAAGALL